VGEGVTHLAIEASSHGLDQHRLDGLRVTAGAFTNLSRDHLDYHPTLEEYLGAKLRLFSELIRPGGSAIVVTDNEHSNDVIAAAKRRGLRVFEVGRQARDICLRDIAVEGFAQLINVSHVGIDYAIRLPLPGLFQIENALVAAGLAIATGSDPT